MNILNLKKYLNTIKTNKIITRAFDKEFNKQTYKKELSLFMRRLSQKNM